MLVKTKDKSLVLSCDESHRNWEYDAFKIVVVVVVLKCETVTLEFCRDV